MNSFEILDHPADIGIKVKGESLEKLFINAALGTISLTVDNQTIDATSSRLVNISGQTTEELFTKWLDEILYLFDSEGFLTKNVVLDKLHTTSLKARLTGEKFNTIKHKVKLYLKAVTYHQLEIKQTKEGWEAIVYFDV